MLTRRELFGATFAPLLAKLLPSRSETWLESMEKLRESILDAMPELPTGYKKPVSGEFEHRGDMWVTGMHEGVLCKRRVR